MDQIKLLLQSTGLSADDLIKQLAQYKENECNNKSEVKKEIESRPKSVQDEVEVINLLDDDSDEDYHNDCHIGEEIYEEAELDTSVDGDLHVSNSNVEYSDDLRVCTNNIDSTSDTKSKHEFIITLSDDEICKNHIKDKANCLSDINVSTSKDRINNQPFDTNQDIQENFSSIKDGGELFLNGGNENKSSDGKLTHAKSFTKVLKTNFNSIKGFKKTGNVIEENTRGIFFISSENNSEQNYETQSEKTNSEHNSKQNSETVSKQNCPNFEQTNSINSEVNSQTNSENNFKTHSEQNDGQTKTETNSKPNSHINLEQITEINSPEQSELNSQINLEQILETNSPEQTELNSQINLKQNLDPNSQTNSKQNSKTNSQQNDSKQKCDSNVELKSQTNLNQNSETNSQTDSEQNSKTNSEQNDSKKKSDTNSRLNSQTNLKQNSETNSPNNSEQNSKINSEQNYSINKSDTNSQTNSEQNSKTNSEPNYSTKKSDTNVELKSHTNLKQTSETNSQTNLEQNLKTKHEQNYSKKKSEANSEVKSQIDLKQHSETIYEPNSGSYSEKKPKTKSKKGSRRNSLANLEQNSETNSEQNSNTNSQSNSEQNSNTNSQQNYSKKKSETNSEQKSSEMSSQSNSERSLELHDENYGIHSEKKSDTNSIFTNSQTSSRQNFQTMKHNSETNPQQKYGTHSEKKSNSEQNSLTKSELNSETLSKHNSPTNSEQNSQTKSELNSVTHSKQNSPTNSELNSQTIFQLNPENISKQNSLTNFEQNSPEDAKLNSQTNLVQNSETFSKQNSESNSEQIYGAHSQQKSVTNSTEKVDLNFQTNLKQNCETNSDQNSNTNIGENLSKKNFLANFEQNYRTHFAKQSETNFELNSKTPSKTNSELNCHTNSKPNAEKNCKQNSVINSELISQTNAQNSEIISILNSETISELNSKTNAQHSETISVLNSETISELNSETDTELNSGKLFEKGMNSLEGVKKRSISTEGGEKEFDSKNKSTNNIEGVEKEIHKIEGITNKSNSIKKSQNKFRSEKINLNQLEGFMKLSNSGGIFKISRNSIKKISTDHINVPTEKSNSTKVITSNSDSIEDTSLLTNIKDDLNSKTTTINNSNSNDANNKQADLEADGKQLTNHCSSNKQVSNKDSIIKELFNQYANKKQASNKDSNSKQDSNNKQLMNQYADDKQVSNKDANNKQVCNQDSDKKQLSNQNADNKKSVNQYSDNKQVSNKDANNKQVCNQDGDNKQLMNQYADNIQVSNKDAGNKTVCNQDNNSKQVSNTDANNKQLCNQDANNKLVLNRYADNTHKDAKKQNTNIKQFLSKYSQKKTVSNQNANNQYLLNKYADNKQVCSQDDNKKEETNKDDDKKQVCSEDANKNKYADNKQLTNQYSDNKQVSNKDADSENICNEDNNNKQVSNKEVNNKQVSNQDANKQQLLNKYASNKQVPNKVANKKNTNLKQFLNQYSDKKPVSNQEANHKQLTNQYADNKQLCIKDANNKEDSNKKQLPTETSNNEQVSNQEANNKLVSNQPESVSNQNGLNKEPINDKGRLPILELLKKRLFDATNASLETIQLESDNDDDDDTNMSDDKKQPIYGCIRKNEHKDKSSRLRKPPWLVDEGSNSVTEGANVRDEICNQLDMLKRKKDPLVDININVSPSKLLLSNGKKRRSDTGLESIKIVDVRGGVDSEYEVINKELESKTIKLTKTNDFVKIKGWRRKRLLVSPKKPEVVKRVTVVGDDEPVASCSYVVRDENDVGKEEGGCVFASNNLDGFLDEQKELNISYDVPNLESSNQSSIDPLDNKVLIKQAVVKEAVADNKRRFTMAKSEDVDCIAPSSKSNPYKPRTLAEKRKMLEGEGEPVRKVNRICTETIYSTVFYRNKKLNVATKVAKDVYIASRNKMKKDFKFIPFKKISRKRLAMVEAKVEVKKVVRPSIYDIPKASGVVYKPGPLSKKSQLQLNQLGNWRTCIKRMPQVFLQIKPEIGKIVHPRLRQFLDFDTFEISEKRMEFALTAMTGGKSDQRFKFKVPYEHNQGTIMLRQKMPDLDTKVKTIIKPEVKIDVPKVELDVETTLKNVVSDLITCLENREIENEIIQTDEARCIENVDKVVIKKRGRRSRADIIKGSTRKTNLELKRLSVKVIEVNIEDEKEPANCVKPFCKFGCVCKSLDNITLPPEHCNNINCIFECNCGYDKIKRDSLKFVLPAGTDVLSARTVSRLQVEAKKNLAPVEKQFTQTVIHANNQTIVVGESTDRKRRPLKYPKRYEDYMEMRLEEIDDDDEKKAPVVKVLQINPESEDDGPNIMPCSVELNTIDLSHILPYCLEHNLYRCHCNFEADYTRPPQRIGEAEEVKIKRAKANAIKVPPLVAITPPTTSSTVVPVKKRRYRKKQKEPISEITSTTKKQQPSESTTTSSSSDILMNDEDDFLLPLGVGTLDSNKPSRRKQQLQTREEIDEKHKRELVMNARVQEIATKKAAEKKVAKKSEPKSDRYNRSVIDTAKLMERNKNIFSGMQKGIYTPTGAICEKFVKLLGQSDVPEPTFKLIQWSSLMDRYYDKRIQIWYNEVSNKTKFIITDGEPKSVSKYKNVANLEKDSVYDLRLDFVRWIINRQVPGGKHGDDILVILRLSNFYWEICGICAKNTANTTGPSNPPPAEPLEEIGTKTQEFINTANDQYKTVQQVVFSNGDFTRKTLIHMDSAGGVIEAALPNIQTDFKWRVVKINTGFSILSFSRNKFRIKCSDIITVMKVSQRYGKTIVINTDDITVNYSHKLFGIYITDNHHDRIFIGPYFSYEDHDLETLRLVNNVLIKTDILNQLRGADGVWYKQVPMLQVAKVNTVVIPKPATSVIDLTDNGEDDQPSAPKKPKITKLKTDIIPLLVPTKSPRSVLKINQPTPVATKIPTPPLPPIKEPVSNESLLETRLQAMMIEQKLHMPKGCHPICFQMTFHPGLILGWTTKNNKQVVVYWPGEAIVSSRAFSGIEQAIKWLQAELSATFILIPAEFTIKITQLMPDDLDIVLSAYSFPHKYFTDSYVVGDFGILKLADVAHHFAVKQGAAVEKKVIRQNQSINHDKFIKLFIETSGVEESRFMDCIREHITKEIRKAHQLSHLKELLEQKKMELLIKHVELIKLADKTTQERMKNEFMNNWSAKRTTTTPPPLVPLPAQPITSNEVICLDSDEEDDPANPPQPLATSQPPAPAATTVPITAIEIINSDSPSSSFVLNFTENNQPQIPIPPNNDMFLTLDSLTSAPANALPGPAPPRGRKKGHRKRRFTKKPKVPIKPPIKAPITPKKDNRQIEHIDLSHMSNAVIKSMLGANFVGSKVTLTHAQFNRLKELSSTGKNLKFQKLT